MPNSAPKPSRDRVDDLLLNIVANSADAILALDPEGRIVYWNEGARALFGYEDHEVQGRHFSLLIPDDVLAGGEVERLIRLTEEKGSLYNYETKRRTKGGKFIDVSLTRTLLHDASGQLIGSSAIVRDISERKALEHQLLEANILAAVGRLSARIAHEIKNPLAGISGAIQVLRDSLDLTDPKRDIFHDIFKEIQRLDNTVNDLLHFARPRKPQLQRIDVVSLLERVLSLLREEPSLKGVDVQRRFALDEVVVKGDPALLQDTFMNLIVNAGQALDGTENPRLVITVARRSFGVMITFTDNGPGIPLEIRDLIFEPFFTTKARGTGLGLAITRKNVEAHGGTIRLATEPRTATSFSIFLPEDAGESIFAVRD